MHRGYIKIWRKIQDSGIGSNPFILGVAINMILDANWKDTTTIFNKQPTTIKRGQFIFGRKAYAAKLKTTERKIRTAVETLKNVQLIDQQTTNKYSIITICNYSKYQDKELEGDQQTTSKPTSQRPANDQQVTTSKELKKVRNKIYTPDFEEFWKEYPKKEGKLEACKKYKEALKITTKEKILDSVKLYAKHVKGKDPQYTAQPATWLNKGRWDDQLSSERGGPSDQEVLSKQRGWAQWKSSTS